MSQTRLIIITAVAYLIFGLLVGGFLGYRIGASRNTAPLGGPAAPSWENVGNDTWDGTQ